MRKKSLAFAFSVALMVGVIGIGISLFGNGASSTEAAADPQIVVALRGTANAVPEGNGFCFPGLDLVDLKTNQVIGTATDCLSDIAFSPVSGGMSLTGTTTFNFRQGSLTSHGRTTVQPILDLAGEPLIDLVAPNGVDNQDGFTHTTGAPAPAGNNILAGSGTRAFKNATGTVRLSGLVDLRSFLLTAGTPITFDCIFVIDLD